MENRTFKMSPHLLYDVITRQAGSVEKSVLEIVQNAIDAKATKLKLTISENEIVAEDNGQGMTKDEILQYFEVFGESSKRGQDKLGEFGMGRGQIFAQGKTIWATSNYRMVIDIQNNGLKYVLEELSTGIQGTRITIQLSKKLVPFFVQEKLKKWLKYVPIVVEVNGEKYSQHTLEEEEGKVYENDDAKFLIDMGGRGLRVFNRGIFVKTDMSYGVSVVVVTKRNLKVNFARNDIMDDCEVYSRILGDVKNYMIKILSEADYHTIDSKRQVVKMISEDDDAKSVLGGIKAFKTGNDQWVSYNEIKDEGAVSFCSSREGRIADSFMQQGGGIVLVDRPDYKHIFKGSSEGIEIQNFKELTKNIVISIREYHPEGDEEELANIAKQMMKQCGFNRILRFAERQDASAWTDGKNFIWLNKKYLNLPKKRFVFRAYELIVHEMAHDNDTERTDLHGEDFYQRYHELVHSSIGVLERFVG